MVTANLPRCNLRVTIWQIKISSDFHIINVLSFLDNNFATRNSLANSPSVSILV